ncbi:MAG: membrane protein insertion efficiency factor YidD [Candidatus Omnitrophica bacterium]|nr:membrane protein insertion efficiency factor YidD [Candidatus Omnitrophota bacterium]
MRRLVLLCISVYQQVSRVFPPRCRYYPTCSEYAKQAFRRYSFWPAFGVSARRVLRCHPFARGGYDPLQ